MYHQTRKQTIKDYVVMSLTVALLATVVVGGTKFIYDEAQNFRAAKKTCYPSITVLRYTYDDRLYVVCAAEGGHVVKTVGRH